MILNGREAKALCGAIFVYLDGPLRHTKAARPSRSERKRLEGVYQRVSVERNAKWARIDEVEASQDKTSARLAVSLEADFESVDLPLLVRALDAAATEMDAEGDVNILFDGDRYGIDSGTFRALIARLRGSK